MCRLSVALLTSALVALASASNASAGYWYDWSTTTGQTITINSAGGNYQMQIDNEPLKPQNPGGSRADPLVTGTDTTAAKISLTPKTPTGKADFINGSFVLNLVIFDTNGLDNHQSPMAFKVDFHTIIGADGSVTTDTATLTPLKGYDLTLGADKFHVGMNKLGFFYVPAPEITSQNPGVVGLRIDFTGDNGNGGGPHDTPEPSGLVLGGLGMALAGLARWRRKRRSVIALA